MCKIAQVFSRSLRMINITRNFNDADFNECQVDIYIEIIQLSITLRALLYHCYVCVVFREYFFRSIQYYSRNKNLKLLKFSYVQKNVSLLRVRLFANLTRIFKRNMHNVISGQRIDIYKHSISIRLYLTCGRISAQLAHMRLDI